LAGLRVLVPATGVRIPPPQHLSVLTSWEHMFVCRGPRYSKHEARTAIAASQSWAEALRRLGMCWSGGSHLVLRKYAEIWEINTDHFDPYFASRGRGFVRALPLDEILVEHSSFSRVQLKRRLYQAELKRPVCELCGQGPVWRGRALGMILDHINGVSDDNRLENLRIACPNCAGTLDTHCARKRRQPRPDERCQRCRKTFVPNRTGQRYCSPECGTRWARQGQPRPGARKVTRPPYAQLLREVHALGFSATGRRYGVSDNAVRKWLRAYERERENGDAVA
jgi:hypothetical protein